MKNKGFSLVELIVVIAIMAILVGVAVPVYTSYIGNAQKNKDIQMVDEIKHAIEIAAIGDKWYDKFTPGVVGTIVITDEGATVDGTKITVNGVEVEPLEDALIATFGDLSDLKVSYDEWTGTLNGPNVTILQQSAFGSDVTGLLGTVQDITDLFATYVKDFGSGLTFDQDFYDGLGVDASDKVNNANQIANGMIVYVADQSSKIDEQAFIDGWCNLEGPNFTNVEGFDVFGQKAAEYAYVQALVDRITCNNATQTLAQAFELYNTDYSGASPYSDVWVEHVRTCTDCQNGAVAAMNNMETDAKAYLALLNQISSSRDIVASNIANEKLYEDSPLVQYVESYVSVADLMNNANASDGDVVLVVAMHSDGNVTVNAYPLDY